MEDPCTRLPETYRNCGAQELCSVSCLLPDCDEVHATLESAITREKQIEEWRRSWKITLIEESNLDWVDLDNQIV